MSTGEFVQDFLTSSSDRWMDGMDDAQTGAMTDIADEVQTDGDFSGILSW